MTTTTRHRGTAVAGALTAMALCGSSVAVVGLVPTRSALLCQGLRYAVAAAVLLAVTAARGRPVRRVAPRDLPRTLAVAAVGLVGFTLALTVAASHADPAVTGVALAAVPVVLVVSGSGARGRGASPRPLVAGLVLLVGAVLVEGAGRADVTGTAAALAALACEVTFTLAAVPLVRRYGAPSVTTHCCLLAAAALVVVGLLRGEPLPDQPGAWLSTAYLAVAVTALAFVLWYDAVAVLGAASAGVCAGLVPAGAALTHLATGGPTPSPGVWAGIAVVVVGLVVGARPIARDGLPS
ncbi:EamA family transporter [Lapillicoccus jejuensis]|uniref:Threonine/homoserine efflux transporter RhtA n=1 Tax=Lapillicoccus jejuensis TaxID=402171 RepID=A0A542DY83_9MICO|nr:EamA family transporter [Lapillicoccus jejuensis]TQJ08060.1 threonine/homoserine efflux transporter RhtA [Lapillicoccus jejuensis]